MTKDFSEGVFIGAVTAAGVTVATGLLMTANGIDVLTITQTVAALTTALAFILAIRIYLRNVEWRRKDEDDKKSNIHMELSAGGYQRVYEILKDKNNDRVKWIMASRSLGEAIKLEQYVNRAEHKSALELRKMEIRNALYDVLCIFDDKTGNRLSLPPAFFYGAKDWEHVSLLDAAREATSPVEAHSVEEYENLKPGWLKHLSPTSIVPIFRFLEYPQEYQDPLEEVDANEAVDWNKSMGLKEGAGNYIKHLKDHVVFGGMCFKKDDKEERNKEWERIYSSPYPRD